MIDVNAFMLMILYMSLIILVVMLIVIAYRTIKLMKKVDQIIDDISIKSSKLNGVFNIIALVFSVTTFSKFSLVNL